MKKLFLIISILALSAFSAKAQLFYGAQFGIYTDGAAKLFDSGDKETGRAQFNISIKPSIGYYFTPKLAAGLKLNFTSCTFSEVDESFSASSINSTVLNVLMGNGFGGDYLAWNAAPYVRYQVFSLFNEKVKLWAELDGYFGMRFSRDAEHKVDPDTRSLTYGVELHPLVSYDIYDNYMLYTSLDFLSLSWDGSAKRETSVDGPYTKTTSQFLFQANPLVAIARAFLNIGVMKKF
ncbi:MAG: hypothetical protein IJ623_02405 [Bacteroidales bacterium]|nr:hypothetical protein [Bacteroidales bacterium]